MVIRFALSLLAGLLILALVSHLFLPAPVGQLPITSYAQTISTHSAPAPLELNDTTLRWQVWASHQQTVDELSALTETLGGGVCVLDANRDGWMDVFLIGGSGQTRYLGRNAWWNSRPGNALLLNQQGLFMKDATIELGLTGNFHGMGCAVSDFNSDGWPDLIVTGVNELKLYHNNEGKFTDVTAQSTIRSEHWSTGAAIEDVNRDGLPDLYITNYIAFNKNARTFERNKGFATKSVPFDASLFDPLPNRLYLNQGDFRFKDVTEAYSVQDILGRSLGARWIDLDHNGWSDLIVINDTGSPNQVYLNQQGKTFIRTDARFSILETRDSRDLRILDGNADQQPDFMITRAEGKLPVWAVSLNDESYRDDIMQMDFQRSRLLNKSAWGVTSADLNNDGHPDLFMANGTQYPDQDASHLAQGQHNLLFTGTAAGFTSPALISPKHSYPMSSRGVVSVDLNNDGRLELLVSNNNNPLQILQSTNAHGNWIGLDLQHLNPGLQTTNARITLQARGKTWFHLVSTNSGFLSQGDARIHLGLGDIEQIDELLVQWPDGKKTKVGPLASGRYYAIERSKQSAEPLPATESAQLKLPESAARLGTSAQKALAELLIQRDSQWSAYHLFELWTNADDGLRQHMIGYLDKHWRPRFAWVLQQALLPEAPLSLQHAALPLVRKLEMEHSMYWLIPLLQRADTTTFCQISEVLDFFFTEEEAVTHRKYLVISPLTEALAQAPEKARCAARALASAERKRAALPLLDLLRQDSPAAAQALRALGLIRDSRAIDPILDLLKDPERHDSATLAEAFMALKRLAYADAQKNLEALLTENKSGITLLNRLQMFEYLLRESEGILFKPSHLAWLAQPLLRRGLDILSQESVSDPELAQALTGIIQAGHVQEFYPDLETLAQRSDPTLRALARAALSNLNRLSNADLTAMLEADEAPLVTFLQRVNPASVVLNDNQPARLAERMHQRTELQTHMPTLLHALTTEAQAQLLVHLARMSPHLEERACTTSLALKPSLDQALTHITGTELERYAQLRCLARYVEPKAIHTESSIRLRALVNTLLHAPGFNAEQGNTLLVELAPFDPFMVQNHLFNRMLVDPAAQTQETISVLAMHAMSPEQIGLLWQIVRDTQQETALRLQALVSLLQQDRDAASKYVDEEMPGHESP